MLDFQCEEDSNFFFSPIIAANQKQSLVGRVVTGEGRALDALS